jgi:hypothetical protein
MGPTAGTMPAFRARAGAYTEGPHVPYPPTNVWDPNILIHKRGPPSARRGTSGTCRAPLIVAGTCSNGMKS